MITFHEFMREVCKGVNNPARTLTATSFDGAVLPALSRIDPDLYTKTREAIDKGDLPPDSIPTILRFLEAHWTIAKIAPDTGIVLPLHTS